MSDRLHEQPTTTNPDMTKRISIGKAGSITENMTLSVFVTWLQSKLSFLKSSNNLSELSATAQAARDNIGAASLTDVNSAIGGKADANKVLQMGVANPTPNYGNGVHEPMATTYVPLLRYAGDVNTIDYQPLRYAGDIAVTLTVADNGGLRVVHNLGHTRYKVDVLTRGTDGQYFRGMQKKESNYFELTFSEGDTTAEVSIWDCHLMPLGY